MNFLVSFLFLNGDCIVVSFVLCRQNKENTIKFICYLYYFFFLDAECIVESLDLFRKNKENTIIIYI